MEKTLLFGVGDWAGENIVPQSWRKGWRKHCSSELKVGLEKTLFFGVGGKVGENIVPQSWR